MAAADGGYDPVTGFDPTARGAVSGCPVLGREPEPAAGAEDMFPADPASVAQRDWLSLRQHSEETRDQAAALVAALRAGPAR